MKKIFLLSSLLVFALTVYAQQTKDTFPNGEDIPEWFHQTPHIDIHTLGKEYVLTDYGVVRDSTIIQTIAIQSVIDQAAADGGGVIVVPEGTFLTGALFFRQGTHLHLVEGGKIKGIDAIKHYPLLKTRLEGQTINYFSALINADHLDGFTITGKGTIDGNGLRYWEEFWLRREYNPECTNLEAMRPRLVYMSYCTNVQVEGVRLVNSPFWTNHLYRCDHVKYVDCYIYASTKGVTAPSSDAIDIDYCHDILVKGCYMNVNDDAVVLKGGKGTYADLDDDNGPCYNIIVEDCKYGTVFGCLTLGSESLHDWNVIMRRCTFDDAQRVLWLKMRPDTPQHYEYVLVDDVRGNCGSFLVVRPWTQFYNKVDRPDMPTSVCNNIEIKDIDVRCHTFLDIEESDQYEMKDFAYKNCHVEEI